MKTELWDIVAKAYGKDSIKALLLEMYCEKHCSQEYIANELNTTRTTITRLFRHYGIEARVREVLEISREEAINLSVAQLARKYSVSKSSAWRAKLKAKGGSDGTTC